MHFALPLKPVLENSEKSANGTIAVSLSSASLAVQAEAAAVAEGYDPVDREASPDILLTDAMAIAQAFTGRRAILVVETSDKTELPTEGPIVQVNAAQFLARLPDLLRGSDDGKV